MSRTQQIFAYLLLHLLVILPAGAQNIVNGREQGEEIFVARTKQFSEFVDRFNYKVDFNGNPVTAEFERKMPRGKMIASLFDLSDKRIAQGNVAGDAGYMKIRDEFINDVISQNTILDKYSSGIVAEAKARVIYKGAPQTVSLFLSREVSGNGSVKWVLLSARGGFTDIFREDTSMIRFIPPASHETDFINLKRALEDKDHLQDYAYRNYSPDLLSIFFFCINTGIVKYEYVEEVNYHIFDIPGWYLKVKDFNRNQLNSGWLITDLSKDTVGFTGFIRKLKPVD